MPVDDVNVLVTFYSRGGLTERIAVWLAEGAVQAGARTRLRRARDLASEEIIAQDPGWKANRDRMHDEFAAPAVADAEWAHVLALGVPAGLLSPELGAYLDRFRSGELKGKVGTAFVSGYQSALGREAAQSALETAMLSKGLTVMPGPRAHQDAGNDWELAHAHGKEVVAIARALNQARESE